jgi:drug/metabolite transporter (DMT)-like permease
MKKNNYLLILLVIFTSFMIAIAQFLLKKSFSYLSFSDFFSFFNFYFLLGCCIYFFGAFFMIFLLKYLDLSLLYPLLSLSFIWTLLLAVFFLGEKITIFQFSGTLLVMLGVIFVGVSSK